MTERKPLEWNGGIPYCDECVAYLDSQPHLIGAAASVGIEHGLSTGAMLRSYFETYHRNGHKEVRRAWPST